MSKAVERLLAELKLVTQKQIVREKHKPGTISPVLENAKKLKDCLAEETDFKTGLSIRLLQRDLCVLREIVMPKQPHLADDETYFEA